MQYNELESFNTAGMSMKGGRKDNFFFCLFEYYPDSKRWFLKSLLKASDEKIPRGDDAIRVWLNEFNVAKMVVDFPLSEPACHTCTLDCPGIDLCPQENVLKVRSIMNDLIQVDLDSIKTGPKKYEFARLKDSEFNPSRDPFYRATTTAILSKPFKRKLLKGFLPYWNRSIDTWIWSHYYDQLLGLFNSSYDSFGNTSLMTLSRFHYLKRHFPEHLELFESHTPLILLELLKVKIISKNDIMGLFDIEVAFEYRLKIIKKIEQKLHIFIYDQDKETIVKNPRAFDSFILGILGKNIFEKTLHSMPEWAEAHQSQFIVPHF